ncbi:peamaclein-like isoform X1 [Triticum dicoccoides]|uniref:peamaclein-like isoform X1 n=1 Tax=Triticum dicoccoides TaxID=85692 RepID=UPI00188FFE6A|nr:peamaclein-like isoform X1 [Triticum dicoccoides]
MKPLPVSVALLALFLAASYQDLAVAAELLVVGGRADAGADGGGGGVPVPDGVCEGKCKNRCSQKVAGRCMGLCMMCCGKCAGCVPLGPLAPKDECPCYRDMKSPKSGRPKCP